MDTEFENSIALFFHYLLTHATFDVDPLWVYALRKRYTKNGVGNTGLLTLKNII